MFKFFTALIAAALAASLALAGCSSREAAGDADSSASSQDHSASQPITFVDQRGESVTLPHPADRIATTVIPSPAIIAAVDGSFDRIVGINESTLKANQQGLIGKVYPQSTTTPTIASSDFHPNMETVLSLKPDVVIQWGDKGTEITEPLEQAGLPTVGLKYGTQEDLETWVKLFGQIIGKTDRADAIIDNMHAMEKDVKDRVAKAGQAPTRTLILSVKPSGFTSSNKTGYDNFLFNVAGGTQVSADNVAKEGAFNVEQLLDWDPEVVFLSAFDDSKPSDILDNPQLASLSAVKNKRVYKTPLGIYRWQVPCAESPLMWNWTAAVLHPDAYHVDLRQMMKDQIKFLYNYDMTDEDIDKTLRFDLNGDSANYAQLFAR